MAAGTGKELRDSNTFAPEVSGTPRLVRSAGIFGPNAGGKTTIIWALFFMKSFVLRSARDTRDDGIEVEPFLLDDFSSRQPTRFEITFATDGVKYQYGFSVDSERVHEEWLHASPHGKAQTWFSRVFDRAEQHYDWYFGSYLKGQRQAMRDSTRDTALFLSTATILNNPQLTRVSRWFSDTLHVIPSYLGVRNTFSAKQCLEDPTRKRIVDFLRSADLAFDDIEVTKSRVTEEDLPESMSPEDRKAALEREVLEMDFIYRKAGRDSKPAKIPLDDESAGTQRLFAWAGPWLDVLEHGYVLAVDEIETSLHPVLTNYLVKLFHSLHNAKGAQLIFTSHNMVLLNDRDLMRRDQIWFAAKPREPNATRLVPLTDYSPRVHEERAKKYLSGRYGAVPVPQEKLVDPETAGDAAKTQS